MGSIPGSGRSPAVGNGTPASILAWKIPWTEEPGGLQSMGSARVGHDSAHVHSPHPEARAMSLQRAGTQEAPWVQNLLDPVTNSHMVSGYPGRGSWSSTCKLCDFRPGT